METIFSVPSITCSVCSGRIKNELGRMDGISGIDIDLKSQAVKVSYDPEQCSPRDIRGKIAEI